MLDCRFVVADKDMNEEFERCCLQWNPNIEAIHWGLKMAAMNGTPTKFDKFVYCPWCGKKLSERKPFKP